MQDGNGQQSGEGDAFGYQNQSVQTPYSSDSNSTNQVQSKRADSGNRGETVISWEASEYIHHQKGPSWYLGFAGIVVILITVLFLLMRDLLSVLVLILMGVAVAVYAGRKPDTIQYSLSHSGLSIGGKHYDFDNFASYAVMQEGGIYSITLMPTRRFLPPVSIYFAPEDGERIVAVLAAVMPHEEREPDFIDRLMRSIHF